MREAKKSGGIGHGALRHEDALDLGFSLYATPVKLVKIMLAHFADRLTDDSSSDKLPDTAIATKTRNSLAVETIIDFLEEIILLIQT